MGMHRKKIVISAKWKLIMAILIMVKLKEYEARQDFQTTEK